ncbi:MAG: vanadium-dependent haloperoxidase [Acidobacteria bacterium]|nr:vanadium-dependent haloperoxidase [Acidobacteriota bacterium]
MSVASRRRRVAPLRALCVVTARVVAACLVLALPSMSHAQQLETVLTWNQVTTTALVVPGANPATVFVSRPLAIVGVAMFDAANSFERRYHAYAAAVTPAPGASPDAAVAQAAHDVLVVLLPSQRAAFDAALAQSLAGLPDEAARDGAAVAAAVLELRGGDGWARPFPPYELPSLPGYWRPTPPANANATFTNYPDVLGFIVPNGRQFLTEGPPALTSERYARDFNETKAVGGAESVVRTAEQTQVARSRGFSGLDAARAFALVAMAQRDALLTSFTGKFLYGLWRPVTAIREAHTDGNDATESDATWTPLPSTPPYPGHPGNMACLSTAQARVLERIVGRDDVPFEITWTGTTNPTVTRRYNGFRQLADEGGQSRIWGGIHFQFETLASFGSCTRLADYAADNVLRAR